MKNFVLLKNVIFSSFLSYCFFLVLIFIFNFTGNSRLESFLILTVAAIISLYIFSKKIFNHFDFSITRFILFAFFIRLFIGYLFFEFYMFPDYFIDPNSKIFFAHPEYLITHDYMVELATYRINNGFFQFYEYYYYAKAIAIHFFMSNLYYTGNMHIFDIAVQNSLFSVYVAIFVCEISRLLNASVLQQKFVLILALYLPFTMISSMIWRDAVGEVFIAGSGIFIIYALRSKILIALIFISLACAAMVMQRYIYFYFPAAAYAIYFLIFSINNSRPVKLIYLLVFLLIIFTTNNLSPLLVFFDSTFGSYSKFLSLELFLFAPINLLRILLGPFPWTNWLTFTDNSIYLIADYFQVVYNLTVISLVFLNYDKIKKSNISKNHYVFIIMFLMFWIVTLSTPDIHISYFSAGMIFLLPTLSFINNDFKILKNKFISRFFLLLMFFLLLNILLISFGITGQSLGTEFR